MKKITFTFLIILLALGCSKKAVKEKPVQNRVVKTLHDFFLRCEDDMEKARAVIIEHDMVKNLTHLQNMNTGGDKYYLLERESISDLINSVTKGVYSDYILINKEGTVLYTMKNDDIFAKNVRTSLIATPFYKCYEMRDQKIFFHDIISLSKIDPVYYLFVSSKVKGGNSFPGIFILQVDMEKIRELLGPGADVIGPDGKYRLSKGSAAPHSQYEYFDKINLNNDTGIEKEYWFSLGNSRTFTYRFFRFADISWIIIE